MSQEPVIEIRNLSRVYRHSDGIFSLDVPRLFIYPAQTSVFLGSSGCGKSTLFDTLGLIARPDFAQKFMIHRAGDSIDVLHAGDAMLTRLRGTHIGYVLQHGGLISSLTVAENIMLPYRLAGLQPDATRFDRLVARLKIEDQLGKKPARLSGGQQQRVAIARALIHQPSVVLADEPTGQLDAVTAADVRDLLVETTREESACLLVVTHDSELFRPYADRHFGFEVKAHNWQIVSTLVELPDQTMKGI